jgi:ABC-type phosphate transport system substrate-binding protein
MRRLLLLLSVLLLGACWAVAQDSTSQTSSNSSESSASSGQNSSATASGATTVQGCLSGSSGNFTLTDKNGNTYQLTGDTAKLSEHVGHEVKVTGTTSSSASAASGGSAAGTAGAAGNSQTLEVSSIKHVSKTCQSGGGMSK